MLKINPNIPFRPSGLPFFYGWVVLFAGIVGILMSVPGQTIGISVFTDHLIHDLEISRVQLSLAYLIGTGISGFIITYAGMLYDRMGARIIAIGAGIMLGATLLYLTNIDSVASFLTGIFRDADHEVVMIPLLILGFLGIRFFGQGVLTMTSRNMVMKWFDKRRGFANAILGIFMSFGFSYSPRIFQDLIERFDWRATWHILAIIVGLIFAIFAFVLFRDNPQEAGLIPDGQKIRGGKKNAFKTTPERDYKLSEAIRTYSFWIFNLVLTMFALYITAMTFHVESIFDKVGYDAETAVSIFFPTSIIAVIFNFSGSWLSDYTKLKYFLILLISGLIIGMIGLINLDKSWGMYVLIAGNGLAHGMFGILMSVTWPRFFGVKHLGSISGFVLSWTVVGSAIGPFMLSLSEKFSNSYNPSIILLLGLGVILFLLSFKADNVNDSKE